MAGPGSEPNRLTNGDFIGDHGAVGVGHEVEVTRLQYRHTIGDAIGGILQLHFFTGELAGLIQKDQ